MSLLAINALVALTLGAAVGSFLTLVAARLPPLVLEDRGFMTTARRAAIAMSWPGSHCDACHAPLGWRDNIPLLSYLLLKGRCRSCGAGFPFSTWLLEGLTAAAAAFCVVRFGWTAEALLVFSLLAILLALSAIDIGEQLLPDVLVVPVALLGLIHAQAQGTVAAGLATAALAGGLLWSIAVLFRLYAGQDGMGLGDVKLAGAMGIWLMPETLPLFLVTAFASGLLFQLPALLRGEAKGGTAVPFGPFLCGSGALFVLYPGLATRVLGVLAGT